MQTNKNHDIKRVKETLRNFGFETHNNDFPLHVKTMHSASDRFHWYAMLKDIILIEHPRLSVSITEDKKHKPMMLIAP